MISGINVYVTVTQVSVCEQCVQCGGVYCLRYCDRVSMCEQCGVERRCS